MVGKTLIFHLQHSTFPTDFINYKCRPIIYLHWWKELPTCLFKKKTKTHHYSRVNKWKLFETVVLVEDTPKSKRQRSKKQSGIPMVSCFTPAIRSWKYRGVLVSAGQDVVIHTRSSFLPPCRASFLCWNTFPGSHRLEARAACRSSVSVMEMIQGANDTCS